MIKIHYVFKPLMREYFLLLTRFLYPNLCILLDSARIYTVKWITSFVSLDILEKVEVKNFVIETLREVSPFLTKLLWLEQTPMAIIEQIQPYVILSTMFLFYLI